MSETGDDTYCKELWVWAFIVQLQLHRVSTKHCLRNKRTVANGAEEGRRIQRSGQLFGQNWITCRYLYKIHTNGLVSAENTVNMMII